MALGRRGYKVGETGSQKFRFESIIWVVGFV